MIEKRHEEPELDISHASLERTGESAYRSVSPCCGSFLLVRRAPGDKMRLSRHDACVLCGQRYRYTDETINGERFAEEMTPGQKIRAWEDQAFQEIEKALDEERPILIQHIFSGPTSFSTIGPKK